MNCESTSTKRILNTDSSIKANNKNNVWKNLRLKNSTKVTIGHISINSLRNMFELPTEMVWDKVDLLMISKAELNSSFPEAQFYISLLKVIQTWQE